MPFTTNATVCYLKVTRASQHTPWRTHSRPTIKRTAAEKKKLADDRADHRKEYSEALAAARQRIMQEALSLHSQFGGHTIDYYYEAIIQTSHIHNTKRRCNRWNAFLRSEVKKRNATRPSGQHYKAHELSKEISSVWKALTEEQKIAGTSSAMQELEEFRSNKSFAINNIPMNAFHDTRKALSSITDQLSALNTRTGTQSILIAVRSDLDHYTRPFVYVSEDRVADFFQLSLKTPPTDIAARLEAYCLSGVQECC
ncbi:hypothetical protein J3R83DRAFT_12571 [Lanmaoa asiatica]|nr:hypothetical protein J3R83DRAFT_12571 [Lanmaoa asiatica]